MNCMEQTNCRDVVVVRIPSGGVEAMEAVRLETIRAILSGVWAIPSSYSWTVEQLPALADVEILPAEGKQGNFDRVAEKKATHDRLLAYRKAHGLGCLEAVAKAARRKDVTADVLRRVISDGDALTDAQWAAVGRALDKLGKEGAPSVKSDVENP